MRWGLLLLLLVVEEVVGGKKYIIKTDGREVKLEAKTKSQSSKLKGPKVGKSRIKSKRSKMKAFDIEKGQDYTEAFSQLPLDKPEKEFTAKLPGGATATLSSCLHLHKLVAKGTEEEVVTRKKEICSEQGLLEFAGEVDGVSGYTPLLLACKFEKWGIVPPLLDCGAPVNVLDGNQMSPLYYACLGDDLPTIRLLMKAGADPTLGMNPLDSSDVSQEAKDLVRSLWRQNPLSTPQPEFKAKLPDGATATLSSCLLLHKLCVLGGGELFSRKKDIMDELLMLNHTGTVDSVTGYTPLLLACRFEKWGIVRTLLDCGAPVNVLDGNQMSPLYYACLANDLPTIRLLMKAGADPTIGTNPLDSSDVSQECKDLIRSLMEPEPLNTQQITFTWVLPSGATATISSCVLLHKMCVEGSVDAVVKRKEEITEELLKLTGKVDDVDGFTPLHLACMFGHVDIVRILLERQAAVNALTASNCSPLWYASIQGNLDIIKILIEAGAVPTQGENPLTSTEVSQKCKDLIRELTNTEGGSTIRPTAPTLPCPTCPPPIQPTEKIKVVGKVTQVQLGCPMLLTCESNKDNGLCVFKTPYGKTFRVITGRNYENGRLQCICRVIHDRSSQRRVCGLKVKSTMQKDIGDWICMVRARENMKEIGGKRLTVPPPSPDRDGKQCTEITFKAKFDPTKKL